MNIDDLLPPENTDVFEEVIAKAASEPLPVPYAAIMNPATSPVEWLPWLAVHWSVDLWYDDWSVSRKRQMIANAASLAAKGGTRAGVTGFLPYVDGILVDSITYPHKFVFGRAVIGRTPIAHPPYVARYLIKVPTTTPNRAFVFRRAVIGRHLLKTPSREPFKRVFNALRVAKARETEMRVDFAHMRRLSIADAPPLDGSHFLGEFVNRIKL